jgi:uncharacterized integral membrane protein
LKKDAGKSEFLQASSDEKAKHAASPEEEEEEHKALLREQEKVWGPAEGEEKKHGEHAGVEHEGAAHAEHEHEHEGAEHEGAQGEHEHTEGAEHEHKGEGAEGEESEEGSEQTGRVVVWMMGSSLILMAFTFAMINTSNREVSNFTWRTLDNVISIFLAVMVFQAVDEGVIEAGIIEREHHAVGTMFVYAIVLLAIAIGLSVLLKGTPSNLAIFVASSAHFVSFGWLHASTTAFEHFSETLTKVVFIFLFVLAIIGAVYCVSYQVKGRLGLLEDDELMEKVDDLENDAGAMGAAISFTMLVCYALTGTFQDVEEKENATGQFKRDMLVYAAGLTMVACVAVHFLSSLTESQSYVMRRIGLFLKSMLAMCVAWAWLLWGKWQYHDHEFVEVPMFSHIVFAFCVSLVGMLTIIVLANLPGTGKQAIKDKILILTTIGLVVGWSWEETFDEGIEILAEGHPGNVVTFKIAAAALMISVLLPVHIVYFKPIVLNLASGELDED